MTDKEILTKAVEKAYKNDPNGFVARVSDFVPLYKINHNEHYAIIFNHEFAKALWGLHDVDMHGRTIDESWEEEYKNSGLFMDKGDFEYNTDWEMSYLYHLKKMVWVDKPLKYLEKFL